MSEHVTKFMLGRHPEKPSLIAKHESSKPDNQGLTTKYGVEDIAERLLKKLFRENYPQLLKHQEAIDKLENEVLQTL
jgi:hypothetical protein